MKHSIQDLLEYGFIVLDKPMGPSSHEASAYASKILEVKKAGHTGTLDPNVSGVLIILLNSACKVASYLQETDKSYVCVMQTGRPHTMKEVEGAFENFRGKIYQTPPLASAVARKLRIREIYSLKILEVEGRRVLFSCDCEAGTYIRKLCEDAGRVLGSGAQMLELRRTKAMGISESKAVALQQLSDAYWLYKEKGVETELRKILRPIEELASFRKVVVTDSYIPKIVRGIDLKKADAESIDKSVAKDDWVGLYNKDGALLAVAKSLVDFAQIKDAEGTAVLFDLERVIRTG
ncbi:MAG: RNA-guided pseudouridylation complex pseudouridine synthase subunit Cbf5 [Candidatus Micrarchaeia archaeon]